jgi:hypothetical protein
VEALHLRGRVPGLRMRKWIGQPPDGFRRAVCLALIQQGFAASIAQQQKTWSDIVKRAGIKPD